MKITEITEGSVIAFKSKEQKEREARKKKLKKAQELAHQQGKAFDVSKRRREMHVVDND